MQSLRSRMGQVAVIAILLLSSTAAISAQSDSATWQAWAELDLAALDDDGSGSTFARSEIDGVPSLMISPSGSSDETKLAYPISGEDLQAWLDYGRVQIDVFLPEVNAVHPNSYFLGLADVTEGWQWVGGVFGDPDGASGWIAVTYTFDSTLRNLDPEGNYMMYLSFFHQSGGSKVPLAEPFYVGAITLVSPSAAERSPVEERFQAEVRELSAMDDLSLIDAVARHSFDYFWLEANPETGLIKDRSTPQSVSSIAAVGFGLAAIPVGIERGWIAAEDGYERARITLQTFLEGGVQGERGFFYHFVDMRSGERVWNSELSSIDTALLVAGALAAGEYFEGSDVQDLANRLYENVQWDWMLAGGTFLRMGWLPDSGFLPYAWDHFDESLLLYVLAIGSPTYPIPASVWDRWSRPVNRAGEYIYLPGEPLFVYQYPLAFLDLRRLEDRYAHYWNNTVRACQRNQQFVQANSDVYQTYQGGIWGLSVSDGPSGYRAYGAAGANHDGTIAPYASISCLPFTPEAALDSMRAMLNRYGARVWREYGFVSAINEDEDWYSREHIGIDQGDILLMIANYQDEFVWTQFMGHPRIQAALDLMGFVESTGDYAVTPWYLSEISGN